jgi:beta-phosphoglucomutase
MTNTRAVLWDMDGTLIDSEELHWLSWCEALGREGIRVTREQFLSSFGQRNASIIPVWLGAESSDERVEKIGNAKEVAYRRLVHEHGMSALPGVAEWVRRLRDEGWLQAIASSAPRLNVETILEVLGFGDWFQSIVSAEDVQRGKPDPQVFLTAAAQLGVPPERCIVVEDAAAGVEAARRAGMRSIGVARNGQILPADLTVSSLALLDADAFEKLLRA